MHREEVCNLHFSINFVLNDPGVHDSIPWQEVVNDLILAELISELILFLLLIVKLKYSRHVLHGHPSHFTFDIDVFFAGQSMLLFKLFEAHGCGKVAVLCLYQLRWVQEPVHVMNSADWRWLRVRGSVHRLVNSYLSGSSQLLGK